MKTEKLVRTFVEYFEERDHRRITGSTLLPPPGDSVLFTTSGMHPLTPYLEGRPHPLGRLTGQCAPPSSGTGSRSVPRVRVRPPGPCGSCATPPPAATRGYGLTVLRAAATLDNAASRTVASPLGVRRRRRDTYLRTFATCA